MTRTYMQQFLELGCKNKHALFSSSALKLCRLIYWLHVDCYMQPSAELVREIATLEVEILRLERRLLSLYWTAFQLHLPRITEDHVETPRGGGGGGQLNQPSQKIES